ncbi:MAG: uroporphyrinogen decarboxylase family protein [Candidatus Izemoplasmatales bacterium]|nr:uroporphyrinogen decarboxylase family protein [Candidatus Izemoplasmatales bacterium]
MKKIEAYKDNLELTISKSKKMYDDAVAGLGGNVSFRALPPSDIAIYNEFDLTKYNYETDLDEYAEHLLAGLEKSFAARKAINDNFFPAIAPILGIGDYSAFITGEIIFRKDTSWSTPCLKQIDDFRNLPPLGTSKWYRKFMEISDILLRKTQGTGIPFMRGFFSPLDLAHALRGESIYYDFYDEPEKVHELLDYCAEATIKFAEDIYALNRKYNKNTKYGTWYTEGKINMSEDIACMISGAAYNEFCAPHTQKVIDHFGVGYMHCHSRAMYLVKEICSLHNVAHLWLATDPNQPRPIDYIEQLVKDANGVAVAIDCDTFAEIEQHYSEMKKGNFSICLPVKSIEEGIKYTTLFERLDK